MRERQFIREHTRCCLVTQLCLSPCNHMDCIVPGSSVHGISQERLLEWVAISSSRGSSWPKDQSCDSCVSWIVGRFFTAEWCSVASPDSREREPWRSAEADREGACWDWIMGEPSTLLHSHRVCLFTIVFQDPLGKLRISCYLFNIFYS